MLLSGDLLLLTDLDLVVFFLSLVPESSFHRFVGQLVFVMIIIIIIASSLKGYSMLCTHLIKQKKKELIILSVVSCEVHWVNEVQKKKGLYFL